MAYPMKQPRQSKQLINRSTCSMAQRLSEVLPELMEECDKLAHAELRSCHLTIQQLRALESVHHHDGCAMHELAEALGKPPSTLTCLVDRMMRCELLARYYSETDRRTRHVTITRKGRQIFQRIIARRTKALRTLFATLHPTEQAACLKITRNLIARLAAHK